MDYDSDDFSDTHQVTRHPEYYLNGGDLFLLARTKMFRVHRYFFTRDSDIFRARLGQPASPGYEPPGHSESSALLLNDIEPEDLARFLWVFYNPKYSLYVASAEDWEAILRLAHNWHFHEVKALAVRELQLIPLPPVERIALYQTYDIDQKFIVPLIAEVCARDALLTPEETQRLDIKTAYVIWSGREMLRAHASSEGCMSPMPPDVEEGEIHDTVRQLLHQSRATLGMPRGSISAGGSVITDARFTHQPN
ncbi:hypothetical protein FISHEDRAFT_47808 [Fistulina hepatica ATCC 64428]|uniref:BTB domain-containing protein n=1 Tax=Fistulina hepatica ATCC 64428 TaxID=1128425 RepID=A0A0D7A6K6_9AGAR|nr:hypothetical protein FISHEDRAFT_47808 [Fistulina hepatica ATCC 64428]